MYVPLPAPNSQLMRFIRAYLVLSTFFLSILGYSQALEAIGFTFSVRRPLSIIQPIFITYDRTTGPIWCHS